MPDTVPSSGGPTAGAIAASSGDPEIGQIIDGRYRIVGMLGQGGMGAVYRAEHVGMGKMLAVKVLHPHISSRRDAGQRFQREAFASGRIDHPNCVAVSDFGVREDGSFYLVMELLQGESLRDMIDRERRIPWPRALHIARHVLRGLAHAHAQGIIHRDIKPENIFVVRRDDDPDFAKILDFGIAKLVAGDGKDKVTREGLVVGTPTYLSPEQAFGGELGAASDLYSLSVVLYEMLAGRPPFESPDPVALLTAHATADIPALSSIITDLDVPEPVELLVRRGLSKLRTQRIASADAYVEALDAVRVELGVAPVRSPTGPMPVFGRAATGAPAAASTPLPFASTTATPRPTGTPMPQVELRPPAPPRMRPMASPHPSVPGPAGSPPPGPYSATHPAVEALPPGPLSATYPAVMPGSGVYPVPGHPHPSGPTTGAHPIPTPGSGVYLPSGPVGPHTGGHPIPTPGSGVYPPSGPQTGGHAIPTPGSGFYPADLPGPHATDMFAQLPSVTGSVTLPAPELRQRRLRLAAVGVGLILFIGVIALLSRLGGGEEAPTPAPGVVPVPDARAEAAKPATPAAATTPVPAAAVDAAVTVPAVVLAPVPVPTPAPEPAPAPAAEPDSPADIALKAALHDLEQGKTCPRRKAAIAKLRELGDPRAIAPLKRARVRTRGGVLGVGGRNFNACLRAEATAAIKALEKKRVKKR